MRVALIYISIVAVFGHQRIVPIADDTILTADSKRAV